MLFNNKFQVRRVVGRDSTTFTEMNHLGALNLLKPDKFSTIHREIFASTQVGMGALGTILNRFPKKIIESPDLTWTWTLTDAREKVYLSVKDLSVVNGGRTDLGKNRTLFTIALNTPRFLFGETLDCGSMNKKYQVRIQSDVKNVGPNEFHYDVMFMDSNKDLILPAEFQKASTKWMKLSAKYGEGAEKSGGMSGYDTIDMFGRGSRLRKKYAVTGDAVDATLAIQITAGDPKNPKTFTTWVPAAEAQFHYEWLREKDIDMIYSRATDDVPDNTGRVVKSGYGLQQLLEVSNTQAFSGKPSSRLIEEYLMDIYYARVKPGRSRDTTIITGEQGMIDFSDAVEERLRQKGYVVHVESSPMGGLGVSKADSEIHPNSLGYGYQFTKFHMKNGGTVTVVHEPLYDDPNLHPRINPRTGRPYESGRMTFLDFNSEVGTPNIQLVERKGAYRCGYVEGLATPSGGRGSSGAPGSMVAKSAAHSGDYYEYHVQDDQGVHMEDPSRCGELIPVEAY